MSNKNFCGECGPAEVPHFFTKSNQAVVMIADVFTLPLRPLVKLILRLGSRQIDLLGYGVVHLLAFFRLVSLAKKASHDKDTDRAKGMWRAADELGIKVKQIWVFGKPINIFTAKLPNGKRLVFEGLPRAFESSSLDWMDNKDLVKKKFRRAGFPVPKGEACFTKHSGRIIFEEIRKNSGLAVVKPTLGSRSRHTRIHVKTIEDFETAFKIAKQICPLVSVEEELKGTVYRVALVGKEVAGVLRRDPPIVVGDGVKTVNELVLAANLDPRRKGVFHEIPFNSEMDDALRVQALSRESVPRHGQKVIVGTKIGRSQGGTNTDVTDEVHPENRLLFLDIAKFLDDSLVGIDFIIEDISKSWRSQMPCGTIELNSVPFLDLHMYPFEGRSRDLFKMLWEAVLRSH